jgi:hypothetical protein
VRGSVESHYCTAYNLLVRPRGSELTLEREQGLVRNSYLPGSSVGSHSSSVERSKQFRASKLPCR